MEQQPEVADVTSRFAKLRPAAEMQEHPPQEPEDERHTIGPAEKLVLGLAPDDVSSSVPSVLQGILPRDMSATRLATVRAFFERRPELRDEVARETAAVWRRVKGDRVEFTASMAEARAQLLAHAELATFAEQAPGAVDDTLQELARYLAGGRGENGAA
jgi:hypothetical protein